MHWIRQWLTGGGGGEKMKIWTAALICVFLVLMCGTHKKVLCGRGCSSLQTHKNHPFLMDTRWWLQACSLSSLKRLYCTASIHSSFPQESVCTTIMEDKVWNDMDCRAKIVRVCNPLTLAEYMYCLLLSAHSNTQTQWKRRSNMGPRDCPWLTSLTVVSFSLW